MRFFIALISLLAAFSWTSVRAQVTQLGVRGAIQLAEEQNPELARTRAEIETVRADKWNAIGLRGLDLIHMREGIPNGGSGFTEQNWHITTSFPFPLVAMAHLKGINYQADSKEAALQSQRWTLRSSVKKAYVELLFTQEMVHLRTQETDLASNLIEVVKGRVEVGESARLDLMKVQLQYATASNALSDANLAFENARYDLFRTIGIDPKNQRYDIVFPDTLTFDVVSVAQDEVLSSLTHHPETQSAALASLSAVTAVRASRLSYLPELKVGYWPQDFGSGYDAHGLEVGFRFALPFVGSSRTTREKARLQLRETELQSVQISLNLKNEAESAWHGFETAKEKVVQFSQKNGSLAKELLQLTREGYQLGQIDLLTVLDTQRTYLSVQSDYYQSLRDYYVSVIEMERLLGRELVFTN